MIVVKDEVEKVKQEKNYNSNYKFRLSFHFCRVVVWS